MCGIVGIASTRHAVDFEVVERMRETLRHRGPDDAGTWLSDDRHVGLGHRRLAIIDLSPAGHQPMRSSDGACCIVFNGEIYNFAELRIELTAKGYAFRSSSDTEVILAAYQEWGTECLSHLNGMFAFAIHDTRQRRVFLARDRAGEKPLFLRLAGGILSFASELKALMADPAMPRRLDREALDCYLAFGYVPGERCILQGVQKLPPAHAMCFDVDTGRLSRWRYWTLPELDSSTAHRHVDEAVLLDELEALLEDAVRRQLCADVPVGVLLSGGVDSSLVTAMAVRAARKIKTFTVGFAGHHQFDETEHARLIARHFGTEHLELEAADATTELLPLLARQFDEPIGDSSMIPTYLVSKLIREHCTVAVGGDGGDELFGGYTQYSRLLWTQRWLAGIPRQLRKPFARAAEAWLPIGIRGRVFLQGLDTDFAASLPITASLFDRKARRELMSGHPRWPLVAERVREATVPATPDLVQRATRLDFAHYLPEDILVKVDRASMLTSLEVRSPLLDHRVIEFAFGRVPSSAKTTATGRKLLLKKLGARVFPPQFDLERKQGFGAPLARWLQGAEWQNFFRDVLLETSGGFLTEGTLRNLFAGQARGRANSERLFALVMLQLWRAEYRVSE